MKEAEIEVLLTVTGEETYADGHKDINRTRCRAVWESSAVTVFRYREEDPSGGSTESMMEFSDGCCIITRTGVISTEMRFVPDQETHCDYGTPFGSIPMTIFTHLVALRQVGDNFHARIRYRLTPEGGDSIECAVTVKAEPV